MRLRVLWIGEASTAESEICCADAMVRALTGLFDRVIVDELQNVFQNWIERLKSNQSNQSNQIEIQHSSRAQVTEEAN
jgi:hypothetical protein